MPAYDLFNGDADGICALHQLRLAQACDSRLLTGVKRDIALFQKLPKDVALNVTALDISFDRNEAALRQVLESGGCVRYFDHHAAQKKFAHPQLECHIDGAPDICTSLLVDQYVGGRFRPWTIVAAYGDNMPALAARLTLAAGCSAQSSNDLAQLGHLLNYNAYGETTADLHIHPADLYRAIHHFEMPQDFIARAPEYAYLLKGFTTDQQLLRDMEPHAESALAAVYLLPDAHWARRLSGILANQLTGTDRNKSFAVLTPCSSGTYVASIRTGAATHARADLFCSRYPGGGGRHAAGGVDQLPESELGRFITDFFHYLTGVCP